MWMGIKEEIAREDGKRSDRRLRMIWPSMMASSVEKTCLELRVVLESRRRWCLEVYTACVVIASKRRDTLVHTGSPHMGVKRYIFRQLRNWVYRLHR
jgi:hypothetical protein